jgi:phosphoribosyl 1,2-cyclic phosphodiesterase
VGIERQLSVMVTAQFKIYGARGSIPVCGPGFLEFGGNTTCLQVTIPNSKRVIIVDAGTGIRELGKDLMDIELDRMTIDIFFTHFHWDHIQGLPFFAPAYIPEMPINITALGKGRKINNLKDIFDTQMQQVYFPVPLDKMGAKFGFQNYDEANKRLRNGKETNVIVTAIRHDHPGGAYSYRFEVDDKALVFSTDIEHVNGIDHNFVEFCRGANVLIHDAQYTDDELSEKLGWGHSSYGQAIKVAELAHIDRLVVTHHDPDHDDLFLSKMEHFYRKRFGDILFAREGMVVEL